MRPEWEPGHPGPFEYDRVLYDRQFMSCLYRHAVVWLDRLGRPVRLLFHNALAASDAVLLQSLVERRPKFAFRCASFADEDFRLIGATEVAVMAETFRDIRPIVVDRVQRGEFALVEGNVYYLPHCPEYRNANNQHVVVLHGLDGDGRWRVVDDDPASILCSYSYDEGYIARFFEHSVNRKLRCYELDHRLQLQDARGLVEPRFEAFVLAHRDTHEFFDVLGDFLDSRFDTPAGKHNLLHDAFALLSGTRQCFASYLRLRDSPTPLIEAASACGRSAGVLKTILARAKLTGALDAADLLARAARLKAQEVNLLAMLRDHVTHA